MRYKSEMTTEDIIRMAREAGFNPMAYMGENLELFGLFHHLAIAAEREACAKVCEAQIQEWVDDRPRYAVSECATAIRARGEK